MGTNRTPDGFALPTILISAVILLSVLVAAVGATVAIRTALRDAKFVNLASLAAETGETFARACLNSSNNSVTWTDEKPLKPNTDCNGDTVPSASAYVIEDDEYRTYFVVPTPVASKIEAEGYVEALRGSSSAAWRVWSSNTASALSSADSLPVGASVEGYWASPPPGYLLEDGSCISRTIYADLYSVIGNAVGGGNCSSGEFRLPDSRGRVIVNQDPNDSDFNSIGEKRGAKSHKLTKAETPNLPINVRRFDGDANDYLAGSYYPYGIATPYSAGGAEYNISYTGGGDQPHNNVQPSIVALRVIKY